MISILVPAKDAGLYIEVCILSVIKQTCPDWELIIVDDHSTDNTTEIIEKYKQSDQRINWVTNAGNGILPALRLAQRHISGEYVTRMDADDLMPENKLKTLLSILQSSPSKSVATGKVQYFSDQPISAGYLKYQNWLNGVIDRESFFAEIYRECTLASPNWMMHADEFFSIGGYDSMHYPEDYDMVFQLRDHGFNIIGTKNITHLWREHPNRASRTLKAYQQDAFFELKLNHFLKFEKTSHSSLVLWGTARKGKLVAKKLLDNHQPFTWMDWQNNKYDGGIYGEIIHPLDRFYELENPLVINTVIPPDQQQKQIDQFLKKNGLILGQNYFVF
ncbi:glycosyltransferase family 2 protein [bacterium]|nr:glycosyltransferase family 2 protein [bacterium]